MSGYGGGKDHNLWALGTLTGRLLTLTLFRHLFSIGFSFSGNRCLIFKTAIPGRRKSGKYKLVEEVKRKIRKASKNFILVYSDLEDA